VNALDFAKQTLQLLRLGGKVASSLGLGTVVSLVGEAVADASSVALSAIDNAQKQEADALAALRLVLAESLAKCDKALATAEAARQTADNIIDQGAPAEVAPGLPVAEG